MASKEVRELCREAKRQGWEVEESGSHVWLIAPDAFRVRIASTPSDHRWLANTVARMRPHGFKWKGR